MLEEKDEIYRLFLLFLIVLRLLYRPQYFMCHLDILVFFSHHIQELKTKK